MFFSAAGVSFHKHGIDQPDKTSDLGTAEDEHHGFMRTDAVGGLRVPVENQSLVRIGNVLQQFSFRNAVMIPASSPS